MVVTGIAGEDASRAVTEQGLSTHERSPLMWVTEQGLSTLNVAMVLNALARMNCPSPAALDHIATLVDPAPDRLR